MFKCNQYIVSIIAGFILISCGGGGGSGSASSNNTTTTDQVSITGVVVVPNLGPVTAVTVTATDLTTNQELGSVNTANADGSYTVPNAKVSNPIIIKVTGGTYLDEATGAQKSLPTNGISACLPNPSTVTKVAVTTVTEIATQAALKSGSVTAASIDAANRNVGSALLGGADPTTTIPIDISKAIPASATVAQKNYARLLAGLAVDAKNNSGGDLYSAAQRFANVLFDATGAPKLSTGGALPADITNLQTAVQNYVPVGTISAANVPPADVNAVIGVVNPAREAVAKAGSFLFLNVEMDRLTMGTMQGSDSFVAYGVMTPDLVANTIRDAEVAVFINGVADVIGSGNPAMSFTPYGQLIQGSSNAGAVTYEFAKDGEFAIGEDIGTNASNAVRVKMLVKRPVTAPTLASVAGTYHIVLMAHSSASPTASAGYTENGTLVLDGLGGSTYTAENTDITTGTPIFTPVSSTSTYSVDPYGVALNTGGNGHILLSDNGLYGLYELHAGGTQEWGMVIKDHATSIPFSAMTKGIYYDAHAQGTMAGIDFHKALDVRAFSSTTVANANVLTHSLRAFAPVQLSPAVMCGVPTTAACAATRDIPLTFLPVAPNTAQTAANGVFAVMDTQVLGQIPNFKSYISQDGGVFWTDDGEAAAIMIGLGR
ncbi:MAG: hypothetical protein R8M14_09010 [Ghiorsea sp.]